jgi:hypothetical protein
MENEENREEEFQYTHGCTYLILEQIK